MSRHELAIRFIEPNYQNIKGLNASDVRIAFQYVTNVLQLLSEKTVANAGGDTENPVNGHLANIHHTGFLTHMDQAKDHLMKHMLACVATMEETPAEIPANIIDMFKS